MGDPEEEAYGAVGARVVVLAMLCVRLPCVHAAINRLDSRDADGGGEPKCPKSKRSDEVEPYHRRDPSAPSN